MPVYFSNLPKNSLRVPCSDQEIFDLLHTWCFCVDKFTHENRINFFKFLERANFIPCEQRLRCIGNMLYAYFVHMDESEKNAYLGILVKLENIATLQNLCGIFELVGVTFKDAPITIQDELFDLVIRNMTDDVLQDASSMVCLCNFFRLVFWEVSDLNRETILHLLTEISVKQKESIYIETVIFTLKSLEKLIKS